ncbi:MAG: ATP-binding protein, partial [Bacteroidota bacterium]
MDQQTAKILISKGETTTVEFKMKANHPEKIIREVVAFANTEGGHLFIGVADNRTIAGLKYPDEDEYVLVKSIEELCRPQIDFEVETIRFQEDLQILHFDIKEGTDKPHFAFLEKRHRYGKAFVRVNDKSIQASYEMRKI